VHPRREPEIRLDPDVVEFGAPPRTPVPWRRWALPAAVVLLLAVAGVVAIQSRGDAPSVAASATPSAPSPTPTATVSPLNWTDSRPVTIEVGHPLLGVTAGWELFARSETEVVRVELAAGRITRTPVPQLNSGGPVSFLALPDSVIVRPLDNVVGYLIRDGAPTANLAGALGFGGPALPGPQPGTVWVPTTADSDRLLLVNADGAVVGPTLTLPTTANGFPYADGSGNVLFSGVGGVYRLSQAGTQRISTGRLVAAGATRWLTDECDDRAQCSLVVIDKSSGARRALTGAPIPAPYALGAISPDGRFAAVVGQVGAGGNSSVSILDLVNGAPLPPAVSVNPRNDQSTEMAWSPDSRWLFFVDEAGRVRVLDPGHDVLDLGVTLPSAQQLTVRPAR
jgi:hypothetical protein